MIFLHSCFEEYVYTKAVWDTAEPAGVERKVWNVESCLVLCISQTLILSCRSVVPMCFYITTANSHHYRANLALHRLRKWALISGHFLLKGGSDCTVEGSKTLCRLHKPLVLLLCSLEPNQSGQLFSQQINKSQFFCSLLSTLKVLHHSKENGTATHQACISYSLHAWSKVV